MSMQGNSSAETRAKPVERATRPASTALTPFRVIDLSRVRAGPTAARQLADWGADVISIEMPLSVDDSDPHVGPRSSPDFRNLNRGKRSMTLNLKDPRGVGILKQLAKDADVLIENFRPEVKYRLGIDYETLSELNPRLVYASISGFGQEGPYRNRPGFDQVAQAMGGLMSVTGAPGQGPMRVGIPIADLCSGLFCSQGIMIALLERELISGRGQWVQTSLLQAQAFMMDFQAARWLMAGEVAGQDGNYHATIAPCGIFQAQDGHLSLAVVGQVIWVRLCKALERPDWLDDPAFKANGDRYANRNRLHDALNRHLAARPRAHWIALLNETGVPCGPIYRLDELFNDPQVESLGLVQSIEEPGHGPVQYLAQPINLTRTPSRLASPSPALGEHTQVILESLGLQPMEIEELRRDGVI
jgi:formyl-CoA transferase